MIFMWTDEHQKAIDSFQDFSTSAPVLGYFDFTRPFFPETDASLQGLGAMPS